MGEVLSGPVVKVDEVIGLRTTPPSYDHQETKISRPATMIDRRPEPRRARRR